MPTIRARASLDSLPAIREYVLKVADDAGIHGEIPPKLDLVLEEVLLNVADHAYGPEGGDVEVECSATGEPGSEGRTFNLTLRDWGMYFDPVSADMPDTSAGIDERPIGGLGLLLVTTLADSCEYSRQENMNVLSVTFNA